MIYPSTCRYVCVGGKKVRYDLRRQDLGNLILHRAHVLGLVHLGVVLVDDGGRDLGELEEFLQDTLSDQSSKYTVAASTGLTRIFLLRVTSAL